MKITKLSEENFEDSINLSMYSFQYKISEEQIRKFKEKLKNQDIFGIYDGNDLAAKLHIVPFNIIFQEEVWEMGGVAGVATYPEYRRKGYVKALILHSLAYMKQKDQIISMLHPFDISFYRKYGWEVFCDRRKITIEKKDLQMIDSSSGTIKRYHKDSHHKSVETIYNSFSKRFAGMLVRKTEMWLDMVYGDLHVAVTYNEDGEGIGYILYEVKERVMEIEEMVSLNYQAAINLWNFICQHDSMVDKVHIITSNHDAFPYFLRQPKQKTEISPYAMARIVDVETCLSKYQFVHNDADVILHLKDQFAPWNNGTYFISSGKVKFYPSEKKDSCLHDPKRGIRLTINALTALLFGYKRPSELHEINELIGSKKEILTLEALIPRHKPYIYDFF
ncbi:GNAT family N-acetyltransferase [Bacillus aquiflavi]|uniref:GNAT family N-acetyltransferase n=1 Tax=Bacillus aquiflavi TaxID=2672567 RepID=A0A6B3W159_9BACI|nr:GNAT family N-acetyltransferase [Bacillus aquiflavi]MBA4537941.1 GNAT family N-acetyltransferase [Bacillus aquiflavi]NEY82197.1 GNAT family N-acetyltransferase [Bacillus aquiflavi]UAC49270.1 GNAT family N-acetyltransferase [Bacillus aquiflavi]